MKPLGEALRSALRRSRSWRTSLALTALVALFFFPLADPRAALATRDVVEYHLPMRAAFAQLAGPGLPQWDPLAHGGQPMLSNPNYGALYPLTWLALLLPVTTALNLLVLVHAGIAAGGALRFARRLGAGEGAALLAALAYTCGPTYLALLHSLDTALAMSFLPWVMACALDLLDPSRGVRPGRARLGLSFALAAILLLGNPLVVAVSLLAIGAFVLGRAQERLRRLPGVGGAVAVALGLAAVQVVPTLARLADSPRAAGLDFRQATAWSFPWPRLAELVLPRVFGDAARPELGLYFGWGIHDGDYPYLLGIAIGLPLLVLAVASWSRRGDPERWGWILMALAGLFLAFGRHNPLFGWAWSHLPGIDKVRFPEKFLLLPLTAAIFAGALGWQRLLDRRESAAERPSTGRRGAVPLAFATVLTIVVAALALLAFVAPQKVAAFASAHSAAPLAGEALGRALRFYRRESLLALAFSLATWALIALAGRPGAPRRRLACAAIALVALELWTYGHALLRTLPARALLAPPQVARDLPPPPLRLFSDAPYRRERAGVVVMAGDPRLRWARAPIERLDSRAGNLFGYRYVLDRDFDLSLTRPAARGLRFYERIRDDPELELRLLGAWGASRIVERKPAETVIAEGRALGPQLAPTLAPVRARENERTLASFRFAAGAELFADAAAAESAALAARLPFESREYLIDDLPAAEAEALRPLFRARLDAAGVRSVEDHGDRVRVAYTAAQPALLVVASTFDRRWRAQVGAVTLPVFETAAGYMAVLLPAGEGEVELRFRDPWVSLGAAISATTLLVALLMHLRSRRRRMVAVGSATPRREIQE